MKAGCAAFDKFKNIPTKSADPHVGGRNGRVVSTTAGVPGRFIPIKLPFRPRLQNLEVHRLRHNLETFAETIGMGHHAPLGQATETSCQERHRRGPCLVS